tara:strand:+ start:79930 stop:80433 length:504 start_codon:yes stop_codon:yes gene_type:complete
VVTQTPAAPPFDLTEYRKALGGFATGVCVVTTQSDDGGIGITVNSFTSVSLDPPLVLWCLDDSSDRHDVFAAAERFAIHVLPVEDREMSDRFAWGTCRLSPEEFDISNPEPPRLRNALVRLDCTAHDRIRVGDHLVIIGAVRAVESRDGDALTYFRGRYGVASESLA